MNESSQSPVSEIWAPSLLSVCFAMLLAGAIGLGIIQAVHPVFPYADLPPVPNQPTERDAELIQQHVDAQMEFHARNYAAAFAILGACLGGALGLLTATRRRWLSAIAGGLLAIAGGAVAGFIVGAPVGKALEQSQSFALDQASIHHTPVWVAMIVGATLGIGWVQGGIGQAIRAAIAGLVAAVIAALLYLMMASIVFLGDNAANVIPESLEHRIFWILSTSVVLGVVLWFGLRPSKKKEREPVKSA